MINWIELSLIALLIVLVFYFVYRNFKMRRNFAILAEMHLQVLSDAGMLERKVKELYQEIENLKLKETDGFLKFVSDSRDWAFSYIEEVQKALAEFDEEVAPRLEWANTFGRLAGETVHTDTIKTISEAYDKLKSVLPENNETPNN